MIIIIYLDLKVIKIRGHTICLTAMTPFQAATPVVDRIKMSLQEIQCLLIIRIPIPIGGIGILATSHPKVPEVNLGDNHLLQIPQGLVMEESGVQCYPAEMPPLEVQTDMTLMGHRE